jgi:hypothetical protein
MVKPISSAHKYIERGQTDILNTQIHRRISVLPRSMYLYVEEIGFTSFYIFVCLGYLFDLFLCICVLRISVLPLSMYVCAEDTDILNTQTHRKW